MSNDMYLLVVRNSHFVSSEFNLFFGLRRFDLEQSTLKRVSNGNKDPFL